jgi:hypothetical protein
MMQQPLWNLIATLQASAAARWTTVRQLRRHTRELLSERRARRRARAVASLAARADHVDTGADDWLESEIVRVITRHPEGVRAFDIGNEIGVDWRCVPAIAGRLVARALVEQIADEFYPAQKAS